MEHAFILGLIGCALLLFASEVVRPDIVAIGVTVVLLLTGTVTVVEGFSGFSNPAVITVICMFILSAGLVQTGIADSVAKIVLRFGGTSPVMLTIAVMVAVGTMSMFMNNIGAVAVLLPVMFAISQRAGYSASKLLIPLAFASLMGGLVTLIGTPPNLLVSMALEDAGQTGFRLFDYAPTGLAIMAAGVLYLAFVGRHLIPDRVSDEDLAQQFSIDTYLTEVVIPEGSPLVGRTVEESRVRRNLGLLITSLRRQGEAGEHVFVPVPDTVLQAGDRLVVEGKFDELVRAKSGDALQLYAERKFGAEEFTGAGVELAEVVLAPRSRLLGRSIKESDIRRRFGVLVLALRRRQRTTRSEFILVPLEVGDVLLVQGTPKAIGELARSPDFVVVQRLEHARRDRRKAPLALGIMALVILAAATGLAHISVAGLVGVLLMTLTGCLPVQDMYRAVEWRVIFLIACMMPLGIAMDSNHTGTAAWLADQVVAATRDFGPLVVLAGLFLFTTAVTEVMSNAAATVLIAPIGIAIASQLGLAPQPFMMAVAISASTTFLTPIGHQANVLVYGVGNYRFGDFPRVGLLLNILIFCVAMALIPVVWPFQAVAR